jgi:hypothetical protein
VLVALEARVVGILSGGRPQCAAVIGVGSHWCGSRDECESAESAETW